ncbi:MAG TPA: efflux RND transporter periplasmic adaptor subunit [Kofleriaceae bacterium]
MLTTLPKHRGQHGALIAIGLLVSTTIVVYTTQSPPQQAHPDDASHAISSSTQRPAATASVTKAPEAVMPPVTKADPTRSRGSGFVTYDATRTSHVAAPVAGWLEKKRSASVGRHARQFEPLATLYSIEVYMATVAVIEQLREFKSQQALDNARIKLLRWGMPKPTLDRIERTMRPQAALPLATRVAGIVVEERAAARGFVEPGELFTVTDPTRVMVFVEVAAVDPVEVGMPAKLIVDGVAKPMNANVSYVFRRAAEGMRTIRLDVHSFAKPKPGARVDAVIVLDERKGGQTTVRR